MKKKWKKEKFPYEIEIIIEKKGKIWFLPFNAPIFKKQKIKKQIYCG